MLLLFWAREDNLNLSALNFILTLCEDFKIPNILGKVMKFMKLEFSITEPCESCDSHCLHVIVATRNYALRNTFVVER